MGLFRAYGGESREKTCGGTKFFKIPRVIKLALPHLCLWSLAALYCVGGALVFMHLEGRDNLAGELITRTVKRKAKTMAWELYNLTKSTADDAGRFEESTWKTIGEEKLNQFIRQVYEHHRWLNQSVVDRGVNKWEFGRSFFFTATTLTSIGYGNQTPSTRPGKIFCIFYALFGLPLVVITIADIAKYVSDFILWSYTKYVMLKWRFRLRIRTWLLKRRQRRASLRLQRRQGISEIEESTDFTEPRGSSDEEVAEFLWVNLVNAEIVEVPPSLMFALILAYVSLGGLYFRSVEKDWSFFEGFYFSLISILAIGFGDFTPTNEGYIYLSLLYVLLGIVLTTTCIDIVGIDYVNKLHFWGRQLDKVDPLQWLKQVQEKRLRTMKKRAMAALFNTLTALHYMRLDPALLNNMKTLLVEDHALNDDTMNESSATLTNLTPRGGDRERSRSILGQDAAATIPSNSPNKTEQNKIVPSAPLNFHAVNISVHSVTLKWEPPLAGVTEDMYYSLSYRLRTVCENSLVRRQSRFDQRPSVVHDVVASSLAHGLIAYPECLDINEAAVEETPSAGGVYTIAGGKTSRHAPRRMGMTGIERIPGYATMFSVNGLKSFALYQFSLVAVNKNGRSRSVRTQEYTEPSTVPLNVRSASVSDTVAKVVWDPPARNKLGPRRYAVHVTSDANKPFGDWERIEAAGCDHSLNLMNLQPMTSYVVCVSASHNRGLATLSRSLKFITAATPVDDAESSDQNMDTSKDASTAFSSPVVTDSRRVSSLDQQIGFVVHPTPFAQVLMSEPCTKSVSVGEEYV